VDAYCARYPKACAEDLAGQGIKKGVKDLIAAGVIAGTIAAKNNCCTEYRLVYQENEKHRFKR
jgi:hypothetical protein